MVSVGGKKKIRQSSYEKGGGKQPAGKDQQLSQTQVSILSFQNRQKKRKQSRDSSGRKNKKKQSKSW